MTPLSIREAFGIALADYGAVNPNVVVLDADTAASTMSYLFAQRFPKRFFNIGIAEPCMIDVAVGLALGGKIPIANAFAALVSLRALEQIRTCVCYARTNVKLAASYAGLSDFKDGPTHHAITDLAIMRCLPEMTVIVPADEEETRRWVPIVAEYDGPIYIRLSRASTQDVHSPEVQLQIGKGITLNQGNDLTLIATGAMVGTSVLAAEQLSREGISARVIEIHTVKPLDQELVVKAAEETGAIVTAEEHSIIGGLGGGVAELLAGIYPVPLERVGILDNFARTGREVDSLMKKYGLSVESIMTAAHNVLRRKK